MTQTLDVNQTFADEKADQRARFQQRLDAGEIKPVGDGSGRYVVVSGWDAGEYLNDQLEPMTELDMSLGTAAVYSAEPMWHSMGNVVPGGTSSIAEVLDLGGIGFEVVKRPAKFDVFDEDGNVLMQRTAPDSFVTVRRDLQLPLGVVGSVYEVLQNEESFSFLEDLTGQYGMVWESAGALRNGSKTFVSTRLPQSLKIETLNGVDEIVLFLVALNSHDGSTQFQCVVTPWRPVCGNTERFALRDAKSKWGVRHTKTARERMDEARKTLRLTLVYADEFAKEEQQLAATRMTMSEFDGMIRELFPEPVTDDKAAATRWARKRSELRGTWLQNSSELGETRYAAERAVTQWLDHEQNVRAGKIGGGLNAVRATRVLEGADDDKKTQAHRLLLKTR